MVMITYAKRFRITLPKEVSGSGDPERATPATGRGGPTPRAPGRTRTTVTRGGGRFRGRVRVTGHMARPRGTRHDEGRGKESPHAPSLLAARRGPGPRST